MTLARVKKTISSFLLLLEEGQQHGQYQEQSQWQKSTQKSTRYYSALSDDSKRFEYIPRMNKMNKTNTSFFWAESSGKAQVGWGKEEVAQDERQTSMLDRCQIVNSLL